MELPDIESQDIASKLAQVVQYLIDERHAQHSSSHSIHGHHSHHKHDWISSMDTWQQLEIMRQFLCQRPPIPKLPSDILNDIDAIIKYRRSHSLPTSSTSISPAVVINHDNKEVKHGRQYNGIIVSQTRLSVWKGDITTLKDVTAIVNAANSQMLGCFQPNHRCIDNVIHTAAGPRLRDACHELMLHQKHDPEPVGSVKVTPGFNTFAPWILHTVGPQIGAHQTPEEGDEKQLADCYRSCLEAAESLSPLADGRKVLVFCCISTGLFAFPSELAANIALSSVIQWLLEHPETTLTDIVFDVFLDKDWKLYQNRLSILQKSNHFPSNRVTFLSNSLPKQPNTTLTPALVKAQTWIQNADYLIITAGAGLSAAIGLDYTSTELFQNHFPAFRHLGLRRLYDVFGFQGWDSPKQEWGYRFLHLDMVRQWPSSKLYGALHQLATHRFGEERHFVRTSNADGLFVANGFDPERVSTPQGQYRYLQCFAKCRPDAVFPSDPFIDAALPFIDPATQTLTDESKIPRCQYCGGEVTICVRGGDYFNPGPFREQERKWRRFLSEVSRKNAENRDSQGRRRRPLAVILELGVGLNTPGVIRCPNEDIVGESPARSFRLIRAGIGASGCAPLELEEEDLAVSLSGDLNLIVDGLKIGGR